MVFTINYVALTVLLNVLFQALESCDLKDLITKIGSGAGAAPAAGGAAPAAGGAAPAEEKKKEPEPEEEEEDDDMGFGLFD